MSIQKKQYKTIYELLRSREKLLKKTHDIYSAQVLIVVERTLEMAKKYNDVEYRAALQSFQNRKMKP